MAQELRRMVSGRGFLAAVLLAAIAIAGGTTWKAQEELLPAGWFFTAWKSALESKAVCFLVPAAAVLPWSDSFLQERRGGFLKACLPRTGRRGYVEAKIISVALGGFLAWVVAGFLMCFLYFVLFFPQERQGMIQPEAALEGMQILLRIGLIAAIVATLGGICGILGGSGYLAFGIPFTGYYFCIILQERYFPDALWLYPPQWIRGDAKWGEKGEGLWMFLLLFLAVAVAAHAAVLYRKLEEL